MENETREEVTPLEIIKDIRVQVDAVIKTTAVLREDENFVLASREISLARTKAQEVKHWLGEALGKMGQKLPVEFRDEVVLEPIQEEDLENDENPKMRDENKTEDEKLLNSEDLEDINKEM